MSDWPSQKNLNGHCETLRNLQLIGNLDEWPFPRSIGFRASKVSDMSIDQAGFLASFSVFSTVLLAACRRSDRHVHQSKRRFPWKSPLTYRCNVYRILTTVCAVPYEGHVTLIEAISVYCPMTVDGDFYIKDSLISRNSTHVFCSILLVSYVSPSATFRYTSVIFLLRRHPPSTERFAPKLSKR